MAKKNTKKNNKQTKKQGRKPQRVVPQYSLDFGSSAGLPMCAQKYLAAITDPFDAEAYGACVPLNTFRPSRKIHSKLVTSLTIGTAGWGYVLVAPCLSNDNPIAFVSNAAYNGGAAVGVLTLSGLMVDPVTMLTNPFTAAQLRDTNAAGTKPQAVGRIVSCGLRWKYTGTTLEQSGQVTAFVDPNHNSVEALSYNNVSQYQDAKFFPPARTYNGITLFAIDQLETNYQQQRESDTTVTEAIIASYPYSGATPATYTTSTGAPVCVVYFQGIPASTYTVELIMHAEYTGALCQAGATMDIADPLHIPLLQGAAINASMKTQGSGRPVIGSSFKKDVMREFARDIGAPTSKKGWAHTLGRWGGSAARHGINKALTYGAEAVTDMVMV